MKKSLIILVAVAGLAAAWGVAPAQAQQVCPPGQTGNAPYCVTPPPPPPLPPAACNALAAKLSLLRATFSRINRTISIFAPITRLASGNVPTTLRAASTTTRFNLPIDSTNGWIRAVRNITAAQARLGTGILTLNYPGDADTRPQTVRLRSANNPSQLTSSRPVITSTGFLRASGTVTPRARGVVRVQIQYINRALGETVTIQRLALIQNGRWSLNVQLPPSVLAIIAARCGTVHSYVLFTGYMPRRMRGEMRSFQVMPAP